MCRAQASGFDRVQKRVVLESGPRTACSGGGWPVTGLYCICTADEGVPGLLRGRDAAASDWRLADAACVSCSYSCEQRGLHGGRIGLGKSRCPVGLFGLMDLE